MSRRIAFLAAEFSAQFDKAYEGLPADKQRETDEVVMALLKSQPTQGMRVKPIQPDKHYNEARINSGDRVVYRVEAGVCRFADIVPHDLINKYGRKPKARG
jgi:hypothetical protein